MAIIETFGLSRHFGKTSAVEDLTMAVETGDMLGFLGPNGAGKTTTIQMLAGMIAPTKGYAIVAGHRTDRDVEQLHEVAGILIETPGFYSALGARRNLEYFAGFYSSIASPSKQPDRYLRLIGLSKRCSDWEHPGQDSRKLRMGAKAPILNVYRGRYQGA
jgi:ABC-2 type transport system ATP-binding protein